MIKQFERHAPGITSIVSHKKYKYITCGSDGIVFKSNQPFKKDELCVVDGNPLCAICLEENLYVASSNNLNSYTIEDGVFVKQLGKFNCKITCLSTSPKTEEVIIGFEDFKIKKININSHKQSTFEGHKAPILHIDYNEISSYLASSSCDGSVKIWDYEDVICIFTLNLLTKSNSFGLAKSLGRFAWSPLSNYLAVPREKEVKIYEANTWKIKATLTNSEFKDFANVTKFSQCESYVATGTNGGSIYVFDMKSFNMLHKYNLDKKIAICSMMWFKTSTSCSLSITDMHGRLGQVEISTHPDIQPSNALNVAGDIEIELDEMDDLDHIIRERELEDGAESRDQLKKNVPDWSDDEKSRDSVLLSQGSELTEITITQSKKEEKKFGDYFREANLANPLGKIVRDSGAGFHLDDIQNSDDIELDIGKVKEQYYESIRALEHDNTSYHPRGDGKIGKNLVEEEISTIHSEAITRVGGKRGKDENLTNKQRAFQPGSTPAYLGDHYLVWNRWGIIQSFQGTASDDIDVEDSLEMEYFDKSIHHTMRITNYSDFTMAEMSPYAVVLATSGGENASIHKADDTESDDDFGNSVLDRVLNKGAQKEKKSQLLNPSKFKCLHFSSWDSCKEWEYTLPAKETIVATTLGLDWCALGSSLGFVRIFTIGGIQKLPFMLAGTIICMTGCDNELAVVVADKCDDLSLTLYDVHRNSTLICNHKVPAIPTTQRLDPKLVWMGYSEKKILYVAYSNGTVLALIKASGDHAFTWIPIANTKSQVKNKSDNYWITSIHEKPQQIRAILCKGSRYPLTIPRPTVSLLNFHLPLIEPLADTTKLENEYWLTWLLGQTRNERKASDDNEDSNAQQANALIKLFALFCRSDRDFKAQEVCKLMPSLESAKMALKYASRIRKLNLAQRLTHLIESNFDSLQSKNEEPFIEPFPVLNYKSDTNVTNGFGSTTTSHTEYESRSETLYSEEQRDSDLEETPSGLFTPSEHFSNPAKSVVNNPTKSSNPFKVLSENGNGVKKFSSVMDEIVEDLESENTQKKRKKREKIENAPKSKIKKLNLPGHEQNIREKAKEKSRAKVKTLHSFFGDGSNKPHSSSLIEIDSNPTTNITEKLIPNFQQWLRENREELMLQLREELTDMGTDYETMEAKEAKEHLTKIAIQKYKDLKNASI